MGAARSRCCPCRDTSAQRGMSSTEVRSDLPLGVDSIAQPEGGGFEATSRQSGSTHQLAENASVQQAEDATNMQSKSQPSVGKDTTAQQEKDEFEATSKQSESQPPVGEEAAAQQEDASEAGILRQSASHPPLEKDAAAQQEEEQFEATSRPSESQPPVGEEVAAEQGEDASEATSRQSESQPQLEIDAAAQQDEEEFEATSRLSESQPPVGEELAARQGGDEFEATCRQSRSRSPFGDDITAQQERDECQATGVKQKVLSQKKEICQSPQSAMDSRCRLALQKSHPDLIQDLDVKRTLDHLYARLILTPDDMQRIEGLSTDRDRRRALLTLLPERGQGAYDELLQSLWSDQPWLARAMKNNYTKITKEEIIRIEEQHKDQQNELTNSLKRNMQDRLVEWKTALEEGVSDQGELLPYIKQPCDATKGHHQRRTVLNTIEIVENSRQGDRLVIYGEAGMGKTTLLKQLARSWIEGENEKLLEKFTYVFLIPLRLVGRGTLLNIICDELGLVPASSMEDLKKSLGLYEHRVLFLLDSFEELRGDVVRSKRTDIDDLITGKIFPKSTVVVTSRPGSKLKKLEDQSTAQLKDLPENEVKPIIQHYFGGNKDAVDKVQRSFPAMAYLQKPINLALFIFIITQNKHLTLSYTQAELFSLVLQYIMLAFAKKKKLEEFIPQPGSYIANDDIHGDIRRLFSVIAKKCFEERKEINVKLQVKGANDLKDFLDFGLFTTGPDTNTVLLPHRLFIEYFAAAHLAENPDVWAALFNYIKFESIFVKSPRLPDVVEAMGLENILRFVVALSPQPQLRQVCRQVGSLFVLERKKIEDCDNYLLVNFEYYSELLRDCCDESGKRLLAAALMDAPVRNVTYTYWEEEDRSHVLFQYLDYKQQVQFLKKVHNFDLYVKDGKSTLSCTRRLGIRENNAEFVVALVYQYDCIIKADKLYIRGELGRRRLDLPASVFTRMSGVRLLELYCCTLSSGLPDYMSDINISVASLHSSPCPTNRSLERVELREVKGLEHCDVITSRQCQLVMNDCRGVRASTLKTCFPRVSELKLWNLYLYELETTIVYETEGELTSWLSTVETVRELGLAPEREGESVGLCHLLNILAEKQLENLVLHRSTLLLDVRDTSATVEQNNTMSELELEDCKGDVDLGQLLEVCSRQCPQLKKVGVYSSNLVFDDEKVESVKQLPGLQKFTLGQSAVHTPAGRRLSQQEAEQLLHRLCPSAWMDVMLYPEPKAKPGSKSGTKD